MAASAMTKKIRPSSYVSVTDLHGSASSNKFLINKTDEPTILHSRVSMSPQYQEGNEAHDFSVEESQPLIIQNHKLTMSSIPMISDIIPDLNPSKNQQTLSTFSLLAQNQQN